MLEDKSHEVGDQFAAKKFPNVELLVAKIASALNKIIQNYPLQEKGQSGGNEGSKRRPPSPRKTDRLLDLQILPGHWSQRFCRQLC